MAFCSKCGNKLEEGQSFCGNCGAPTVEEITKSEVQESQQAPVQTPVQTPQAPRQHTAPAPKIQMPNVNTEKVMGFMTEIWNTVKAMVTAPGAAIVRTGELLGKEACLILLGIIALVNGLLGMWSASAVFGGLLSSVNKATAGLSGLFGFGVGKFSLPYFRVFLGSLLTVIVAGGALFGALYLITKFLFKKNVNIFTVLKLVACAFIPYTIATVLQILISYLSIGLAMVPLAAGVLFSAFALYEGIKKEFELTSDQAIITLVLACLVMLLGIYLVTKAMLSFYLKGMTKGLKNINPLKDLNGLDGLFD